MKGFHYEVTKHKDAFGSGKELIVCLLIKFMLTNNNRHESQKVKDMFS